MLWEKYIHIYWTGTLRQSQLMQSIDANVETRNRHYWTIYFCGQEYFPITLSERKLLTDLVYLWENLLKFVGRLAILIDICHIIISMHHIKLNWSNNLNHFDTCHTIYLSQYTQVCITLKVYHQSCYRCLQEMKKLVIATV